MASLTDILKLADLATGESGVLGFANWGEAADSNFAFLEDAVGEVSDITLGGIDVNLSDAQHRSLLINLTGTLSANVNVNADDRKGFWFVRNNTSGSFTVTFKTVSGSGVTVTQGEAAILVSDGTDVLSVSSFSALGLGTAAAEDIGTSGATVPLLDGANTWSDTQIFPEVAVTGTSDDTETGLVIIRDNRTTGTSGVNRVLTINSQASGIADLYLGNDGNSDAVIAGHASSNIRIGSLSPGSNTLDEHLTIFSSGNAAANGNWTINGTLTVTG